MIVKEDVLWFYNSNYDTLVLKQGCVSYLQLHHHLRLLWPGTDTSGSGRLHLLEPKTNSDCMSNRKTTLKTPICVQTTNVSCEELVILIYKSSWNTKISSKFTWIRERAVDQDCVQQSVPNIWPQQHQTSDDLHMHQNTEVGPYFGFSMICNSGQIQITINIQTFNNLRTPQTTKRVWISALLPSNAMNRKKHHLTAWIILNIAKLKLHIPSMLGWIWISPGPVYFSMVISSVFSSDSVTS